MTLPVGFATIFLLPDTPHNTRAWYLTKNECALAIERVEKAGKAAPVPITWAKIRRMFTRWSMPDQNLSFMYNQIADVSDRMVCACVGIYRKLIINLHFSLTNLMN